MDRVEIAPQDQPHDGSAACICCPVEVRDLMAVIENYLSALDGDDGVRINRELGAVRRSVARMQMAMDAHFEDRAHWDASVGRVVAERLRRPKPPSPEVGE